jgi:hypothetical protein
MVLPIVTGVPVVPPENVRRFQLPDDVQARLQHLLDRQDQGIKLTYAEREEAEFLVASFELLSLVKLRADRLRQRDEEP